MKFEDCKNCEFCEKYYSIFYNKLLESGRYWECKKYSKTTLKQMKECGFFNEKKQGNNSGVLTVFDELIKIEDYMKNLQTNLDAIRFNILSCINRIEEEKY